MVAHPYFTRLWIVEEVLLALEVLVMIQLEDYTLLLPAVKIKGLLSTLRTFDNKVHSSLAGTALFALLGTERHPTRGSENLRLADCIRNWSGQQCKDPRDHVFSLMSLVDPSQRMYVDYRRKVEDVFTDTSRTILTHEDIRGDDLRARDSDTDETNAEHTRLMHGLIMDLAKSMSIDRTVRLKIITLTTFSVEERCKMDCLTRRTYLDNLRQDNTEVEETGQGSTLGPEDIWTWWYTCLPAILPEGRDPSI